MEEVKSYCTAVDIMPQFNFEITENAKKNLQETQKATLTQMCSDRNEVIRMGTKLAEISTILGKDS